MKTDEATENETAAPSPKILVVDDEPGIVAAVSYNLRQIGCTPIAAGDAEDALRLFRDERPDLVILDIMLPSGSGFDVCRLLRQDSHRVPILMLTARVAEEDRVRGLDGGADDYLVKPFGMRELLARVRALLRRAAPEPAPSPASAASLDLEVDREKREVRRAGEILPLSRKEFDLLVLLWSHPGRVWDRQTLLDRVWGADAFVDDRTVDVHIRWLREKIEPVPGQPHYLLTVRGVGYKFRG